jgi:hypothetical protein
MRFARKNKETSSNGPVLNEDKGQFNGSCNRTACQAPHAIWWNRGSHSHYCARCKTILDFANRHEAMQLFHGPLCVPAKSESGYTLFCAPEGCEDKSIMNIADRRFSEKRDPKFVHLHDVESVISYLDDNGCPDILQIEMSEDETEQILTYLYGKTENNPEWVDGKLYHLRLSALDPQSPKDSSKRVYYDPEMDVTAKENTFKELRVCLIRTMFTDYHKFFNQLEWRRCEFDGILSMVQI